MKTFDLLKTGGIKYFTQDDLLWAINGLIEAIKNGLTFNGQQNYIISGCQPTAGSGGVTFQGHTAGLVMLNGEVCAIDADTVGIDTSVDPTSSWVFEKVATYDASGLKVFYSGGPTQMYKITKAEIVVDASPPADSYDFNSMPRQETLIAQAIEALNIQFQRTVGLHKGTATAISSNTSSLSPDGNYYEIPVSGGETLSTLSASPYVYFPAGTLIYVRFTGAAGAQVSVAPGGITTPSGGTFVYYTGDVVGFVSTGGGGFALIDKNSRGAWQTPSSFGASWTNSAQPFRYRLTGDGMLVLDGGLQKGSYTSFADAVFTFSGIYRPAVDKSFAVVNVAGQVVDIFINASTGVMTFLINGISSPASVSVSLTGISIAID